MFILENSGEENFCMVRDLKPQRGVCVRVLSQSWLLERKKKNCDNVFEVRINELNLRRAHNHFEITKHLISDPLSHEYKRNFDCDGASWASPWCNRDARRVVLHDNIHKWVFRDESFWHLRPPFVAESVTHDLELIPLWERNNAGRATSALQSRLAAPSSLQSYSTTTVLRLLWTLNNHLMWPKYIRVSPRWCFFTHGEDFDISPVPHLLDETQRFPLGDGDCS